VGYATLTDIIYQAWAGLTATNITKEEHPQTMSEHAHVATRGGSVARVARKPSKSRQERKS